MPLIPKKPAAACMCVTAKVCQFPGLRYFNRGQRRRTYLTPVEDGSDVSVKNDRDWSAGDVTAPLLDMNP